VLKQGNHNWQGHSKVPAGGKNSFRMAENLSVKWKKKTAAYKHTTEYEQIVVWQQNGNILCKLQKWKPHTLQKFFW
jgi:hypothetical protein